MFDWLELLPSYLLYLALFLIVFPTLAAALLRLSLYSYLTSAANKVTRLLIPNGSRGQQPKIVEELESRYKQAIQQLEHINTTALIDGVYSQEKFRCFGLSLRCEQWDYFCKVLPNLLLSFGLLGTFLGITLNLYNLSQTINQAGGDINNLVQQLQAPLQSMGIAFITSLIALICSCFLILVNFRCNTNLARCLLISSLEDYLDNIYKPQEQGDTRLDKAVNKMVKQQDDFLKKFHKNVTEAVESSLGRVAQQFADGNREATDLAKQVYEKLTETSGTIASGAEIFKSSTEDFKTTALFLDKQVQKIDSIIQHQNFVEYSKRLENSTNIFQDVSEKIEQSQFADKLVSAAKNFEETYDSFAHSTLVLSNSSESIESAIVTLNTSGKQIADLGDHISTLNQDTSELISSSQTGLNENKDELNKICRELMNLVKSLQEHETQVNEKLHNIGNHFANSIRCQENSHINFQKFAQEVEQSLRNTSNLQTQVEQVLAVVQETKLPLKTSSQLKVTKKDYRSLEKP